MRYATSGVSFYGSCRSNASRVRHLMVILQRRRSSAKVGAQAMEWCCGLGYLKQRTLLDRRGGRPGGTAPARNEEVISDLPSGVRHDGPIADIRLQGHAALHTDKPIHEPTSGDPAWTASAWPSSMSAAGSGLAEVGEPGMRAGDPCRPFPASFRVRQDWSRNRSSFSYCSLWQQDRQPVIRPASK